MQTKRQAFLWNMVEADIVGYRNIELDAAMIALSEKVREKTGRDDGSFMVYYAMRVTYVANLTFVWEEGAPEEYTNLERWWDMVLRGDPVEECYLYYIRNLSNVVTNQFQDALERAHTIWKPAHEIMLEENSDPNSASGERRSKKKSVVSSAN